MILKGNSVLTSLAATSFPAISICGQGLIKGASQVGGLQTVWRLSSEGMGSIIFSTTQRNKRQFVMEKYSGSDVGSFQPHSYSPDPMAALFSQTQPRPPIKGPLRYISILILGLGKVISLLEKRRSVSQFDCNFPYKRFYGKLQSNWKDTRESGVLSNENVKVVGYFSLITQLQWDPNFKVSQTIFNYEFTQLTSE